MNELVTKRPVLENLMERGREFLKDHGDHPQRLTRGLIRINCLGANPPPPSATQAHKLNPLILERIEDMDEPKEA